MYQIWWSSPSGCRDGWSRDNCCRSLSSHDTPTDRAHGHLLPSVIESVVGVQVVITPALWLEAGAHHHLVAAGPAPAPQPAAVDTARHRLHVGLHPRDVARHFRQDGCLLSNATPPTSLAAAPLDTAAFIGPLLTAPGLVPGRVAIRIEAWTVRDLQLLQTNACCSSVRYLHVIPSMTTIRRIPHLS